MKPNKESKKSIGNRLGHAALNLVLVGVLALATAVVILPRATGSVPLTVLTGSMTPTIHPGDLVIVRPTPLEELHLGDIVTFQPVSGVATLVTHRIISISHDAQRQVTGLQTQGDANNVADNPLVPGQVMGRVWYTVPYIGRLTNGRNTLLLLGAVGAALVVYAIGLVFKKDPENPEKPLSSETTPIEGMPTIQNLNPPPKTGRHLRNTFANEAIAEEVLDG